MALLRGITPVILCGGGGTRLWPRSCAAHPKPFLPLIGERTLFEAALARCCGAEGFAAPLIVAGSAHLALIEAQSEGTSNVIVEPSARNTAAAIALAALRVPEDAILLICPSDHHIADVAAFRAAAVKAAALAADDWLVSFGIEATAPETGFGYLERGDPIGDLGFRTARFIEKPDRARAEGFVASGKHAWNGGIFAFRAGAYLAELGRYRPDIAAAVRAAVADGRTDGARFHPAAAPFDAIKGDSVDYAIMEKTDRAAMVPVDMGWSDIGNWDALHAALPCDASGNAVRGTAELVDCHNVLVDSDGPRVSAIGLDDIIIVVNGEDVLVTTRAGAQKVGKLTGALRQ